MALALTQPQPGWFLTSLNFHGLQLLTVCRGTTSCSLAMAIGFGSNPASIIGFQLLAMCRGAASCSFGNGNWFPIGLQLLTVCRGTSSYSFGNGNWFWL